MGNQNNRHAACSCTATVCRENLHSLLLGFKQIFHVFVSLSFDIALNGQINQNVLLNKKCLFGLIETKNFYPFTLSLSIYHLTAVSDPHCKIWVTIHQEKLIYIQLYADEWSSHVECSQTSKGFMKRKT